VKVGTDTAAFSVGAGGGVGKYLSTKRPLEKNASDGGVHDVKKKRKIGFGEFEGW
jgi:peptidyl-prolyl cis-trans isomerase-like protein 2